MNFSSRPPDDPLDALLDRWGESPACRPLAREVRRRLRVNPRAEENAGGQLLFTRPAFATLFLVVCVTLGLFLAEVRISEQHRQRDDQLLASYRQLIDPLLHTPAPAGLREEGSP